MNAFVSLYVAPSDWAEALKSAGCTWSRAEPQPIADQIKLYGFGMPEGLKVNWLRTVDDK